MKSLAESIMQIQQESVEQIIIEKYVKENFDDIVDMIHGMCEEQDIDPSSLSEDRLDEMLDSAISYTYLDEARVGGGRDLGVQKSMTIPFTSTPSDTGSSLFRPNPKRTQPNLTAKIGMSAPAQTVTTKNPATINSPSKLLSPAVKSNISGRLSHGWQVRKQVLSTLSPEHHAALKEKGLKASFRKNKKTGKVEMHTVPISHNLKIHPSRAEGGLVIGHAAQDKDGKWSPEVYSDVRGEK